jgi:hypothetical protein
VKLLGFAVIPLFLLMLEGCSWAKPGPLPAGFQGKELLVTKPLKFGPDQFSVYFQYGRPVTQREITIWDYYCNLSLKDSRSVDWTLEGERYGLTGFKAYIELCDFGGTCDMVNEYALKTYDGPQAEVLSCRRRTSIGDPSGYLILDVLSPSRLEAILGDNVEIQ